MCLYSNESYISDNTLKFNVYNLPVPDLYSAFNTFCDNFAFINEWYHVYKTKLTSSTPRENCQSVIGFIDIISKYVIRIEKCLLNINSITPSAEFVDMRQFEVINNFCKYWLEYVRGKREFETVIEKYLDPTKVITEEDMTLLIKINGLFETCKNINEIYNLFKNVFNKIDTYFKTHESKIFDEVKSAKMIISTIIEMKSSVFLLPKIKINKLIKCNSVVDYCRTVFDSIKIK